MECDNSKLFVGGFSKETTYATLKDHFERYGVVSGSTVSKDRVTGEPRGFGFVWFTESSSADKAVEDTHVILGRTVDVKKAKPRRVWPQPRNQPAMLSQQHMYTSSYDISDSNEFRTRKVFVGGLPSSVTELEFKKYFEQFGRVTDVVVMMDGATLRPRGFGFITFDSGESVDNVMGNSNGSQRSTFHELSGKTVEVKRAVPREGNYGKTDGVHQPGNHPRYTGSPATYGFLPSPPLYNGVGGFSGGSGVYCGWYPSGGYAGVPYGIAPFAPQAWMFPYGNSFYPAYMSDRGWVAAAGRYSISNGLSGQALNQRGFVSQHVPAVEVKSSGAEGEKHNVEAVA